MPQCLRNHAKSARISLGLKIFAAGYVVPSSCFLWNGNSGRRTHEVGHRVPNAPRLARHGREHVSLGLVWQIPERGGSCSCPAASPLRVSVPARLVLLEPRLRLSPCPLAGLTDRVGHTRAVSGRCKKLVNDLEMGDYTYSFIQYYVYYRGRQAGTYIWDGTRWNLL